MTDTTGPENRDDAVEQLQPSDTLVDRGVDDVLDEGYVAPDDWSTAQGYGNTPAEQRDGETLEMRIKQEIPDPDPDADVDEDWRRGEANREVGSRRAGRLVAVDGGSLLADHEAEALAREVGIDGAAASAEEAAMHVIEPEEEDEE